MPTDSRDQVTRSLDAQGQSIDALHHQLASTPGVDKDRLQNAVDRYKAAHQQFCDDALGCMN